MLAVASMRNNAPPPRPFDGRQISLPPILQVASMVAQSLDLPPRAARWRHQQRHPAAAAGAAAGEGGRGGASRAAPAGGAAATAAGVGTARSGGGALGEEGEAAAPAAKQDVRSRVAGMLEKERDY